MADPSRLNAEDVFDFPFAILEVKLADPESPPPWIQNVLDEFALPASRFSKARVPLTKPYRCVVLTPTVQSRHGCPLRP